jgi:RimJ/RimL family protein N-acetyltransferase
MEGSSCKSADGKELGGNGFTEITLRPLDLSDIDHFMVWASDDKVTRFCSWDSYTRKEEGIDFIKSKVSPHPWFRAICLDNRPIGAISVAENSGINDKCRGELGYVLGAKYWGKGIATRAVKLVANTIFSEWPHLERLEALVDVENVGSQRVLEKAGFQREGVLRKYITLKGKTRDMVMFSLLSTDPQT